MANEKNQNGWNEYSKLVLKELETLGEGISSLRNDVQEVRQEIAGIQSHQDHIVELREWKNRVDEIASPMQLKELTQQISELRDFKIRAITVFAVVQFGMAATIWWMNMAG